MELLLYKSCLNHLQNNKSSMTEAIKKIPKLILILLIMLLVTAIGTLVTICVEKFRDYSFIALIIETVAACIVFSFDQHYEIKNSNQDIKRYKEYCSKLFKWLKNTTVSVERKDIIDIKNRIDNMIREHEQKQQRTFDLIIRFVQTLIIPIYLAVLTVVLNKHLDISMIFAYGFVAIIIPLFVAVTSFGFVSFANLFRKTKIEKMKSFSKDLQGVLDTQLGDGIFAKNNKQ